MVDPLSLDEWKSHIVLACVACEDVVLCTKIHESWTGAREASRTAMSLISANPLDTRKDDDIIVNLFLPTTCSSCSKIASWESISISRSMIEAWQPYLAMRAFLEGDLSLLGSSISLVHYEAVRKLIDADYVIQSAEVNPSSGAAAHAHPYLKGGFFSG
jgi:hypothetical protein